MISSKGGGINHNGTGYRSMDMETLYFIHLLHIGQQNKE